VVTLARQPRSEPGQQLAMWIATEGRRAKDELGELSAARAPLIPLPAGWEGTELEAAQEDGTGYTQRVRVVLCGRVVGDVMIFTVVALPESIAREASALFVQLLASIGPA
jgi:hypothetical protein